MLRLLTTAVMLLLSFGLPGQAQNETAIVGRTTCLPEKGPKTEVEGSNKTAVEDSGGLTKGSWPGTAGTKNWATPPARCELYQIDKYEADKMNLCRELVNWPVAMMGVDPNENGYETQERKQYKEHQYGISLRPLLDREGCKTDFVFFHLCHALPTVLRVRQGHRRGSNAANH
jgi:hypothetical protein